MTERNSITKKTRILERFAVISCVALSLIGLIYAKSLRAGFIYGLNLCVKNLIPTLFPFFILSDYWSASFSVKNDSILGRVFTKIFGISHVGLIPLVCGIFCGFPLGVKCAVSLYEKSALSRQELLRLCVVVNNPSISFVIFGVGYGMYGSIRLGIILYISVLISALTVGFIFRQKKDRNDFFVNNIRQSFDFINSIKGAGISSITVSSYIIFFSMLIFLLKEIISNDCLTALISPLLEVGSACSIIYDKKDILGVFALPLTAFALGFSGLSVHMQSFVFLPKYFSKSCYLFMKLMVGILCSAIMSLFILFVK